MTDEDLHAALQEISGVGEATADKIVDVVADHQTGTSPNDIADQIEEALGYAARDRPDYAESLLVDLLEDLRSE